MHAPLASNDLRHRRARVETLAAAVVSLAFLAASLWAIFARGPWYDEFYTLYVAGPRFPLAAAWRGHWLVDNHPPLFYALARASAFLGDAVEPRRLLNLAIALAAGVACWRALRAHRAFAAALVMVLAAQSASLLAVSELRSYFASLAAATLLTAALVRAWLDREERPGALLWVASLLAFNLHIVTTIIAAATIAPFVLAAGLRRDWRLARTLALPALVAGAVFAALTAIQLPLWLGNTQGFWIPAGLDAARWPLEHLLVRTATANLIVLAGAIVGAALVVRNVWRNRRSDLRLEAIGLLGAGAALAAVTLIGLHLVRPLVMEKYLIALVPVIAAALALGFTAMLDATGRWRALWLGAAALASLAAIIPAARQVVAMNSWNASAAAVAKIVARCPATAVHVDPAFVNGYTLGLSPADNRAVIPFAYRTMAQRHGFAIEPDGSRRMPARCPALVWGEHDTSRRVTAAALLAHERARGFPLARLELTRIGDGWIASDRPL